MTLADKYNAVAQGGKIIKKDMVYRDNWFMDSVMEYVLMKQANLLDYSLKNPKALVNLEYYDLKKVNGVFKNGKLTSSEEGHSQVEDLSAPVKAKAGRQKPARPEEVDE